ncbi:MAG: Gfo/Idh/MocA family oxidoreductase [Kiritimatiellia bacterium]
MIKIAMIGLDTSHSLAFPRLMQGPAGKITGMRAVTCLRFMTPFTNQKVLDERQQQLEALGVRVTENPDEALDGCDAIMLEINDGSYHLEYFKKVAALGKPVFLDKPLACSLADGRAIMRLAHKHGTRVWSGSSIPFASEVAAARAAVPEVRLAHVFGNLGVAPAGDSLVWYGVHVFETLQRLMGPGALKVRAVENEQSVVALVDYGAGRQGLAEVVKKCGAYGGRVQGTSKGELRVHPFVCGAACYALLLREIKKFFAGGQAPVAMPTTFEGLAMMIATRRSIVSGRAECVAAAPDFAGR